MSTGESTAVASSVVSRVPLSLFNMKQTRTLDAADGKSPVALPHAVMSASGSVVRMRTPYSSIAASVAQQSDALGRVGRDRVGSMYGSKATEGSKTNARAGVRVQGDATSRLGHSHHVALRRGVNVSTPAAASVTSARAASVRRQPTVIAGMESPGSRVPAVSVRTVVGLVRKVVTLRL
eukprot:GFYU01026058.1.p1 GENE.GFYU01026058.1~~GFYU01026058.1.p1  ORF type:complete len:196 (+),score=11.25 GFYU01026058.1:54-590(+)